MEDLFFWNGLIFWVVLIVLVAVAVTASLILVSDFPLTTDEGEYIVWASLLATGYKPYTEVYLTNPPFSPAFLGLVWYLWPTPMALKLALLLVWAAGLIAVALIGNEITADWRVGLGIALLLAFSVQYFAESQVIIVTILSIVPGLYALWLALVYQRTGRLSMLIGSALFTAISLELKLLSPFLPLLVVGVVLSRHISGKNVLTFWRDPDARRQAAKAILIWGMALIILPLLSLILFDAEAMLRQAIWQPLTAKDVYSAGENYWPSRLKRLNVYLSDHRSLITLAVFGLGLGLFYRKRGRWLLVGWLGLVLAMFAFQTPLRSKHLVLLSAPLALAAGYIFTFIRFPNKAIRWGVTLVVLIGLFSFGLDYARQLSLWQAKAQTPDPPLEQIQAIDFITAITSPTDCLITDYAQLQFWTARLPPPELAEVASNRIKTGYLTTPELMKITQTYECPVVAPLTGRFNNYLPDYVEGVKEHYYGRFVYSNDTQVIYFGKPLKNAAIASKTEPLARFGLNEAEVELELLGFEDLLDQVQPGQAVPLKLFWRVARPPEADYTIFVQLRNAENAVLAGADHQPYKSLLPFSKWPVGEVMPETAWLQLPSDLPAGNYPLLIGLYDQATLERLPVLGDVSGENAVQLGRMTIAP